MPDPAAVNSMFGRIAHRYDAANRLLTGGIDIRWRRRLVSAVQQTHPSDILDLATGSGDVAFALSRAMPAASRVLGMDFCQPMLDQAEVKKAAAGPGHYQNVRFQQGDGLALPLPDATFEAVTIAFGLRNLADRAQGLREMRRVLRPGGHLFVLEFSQPHAWFRQAYYLYLSKLLPRIAGLVTGDRGAYEYLNQTIAEFPGRAALSAEILATGFSSVQAEAMTCGIVALHSATK
jgi:demethylmenaquinone methyltransferase / 2-methoxy-6-polyprenyl-1,4-benzoquinol methylase